MPALLPLAGVLAFGQPALAVDAAWSPTPSNGDFNNDANWVGGDTPDGTATFGASTETNLSIGSNTVIGAFTINSGAYTFTNTQPLTFTGAGITVNGGSATLDNNWIMIFGNASTAGDATITNDNGLVFQSNSTAGDAYITNNAGLDFSDSSSAGSGTVTNNALLQFLDSSTAANADITNANAGILGFNGSSTAGSADIANDGILEFHDGSAAGSATITNSDTLAFQDTSTAGNATITTTSGATTSISATASGGDAQFITQPGGAFSISGLSSGGTTAGSIEGPGSYVLGNKNLEVGSNDLSTEVSGVISGVGGSLTKVGSGTLELSGTNTYTGATTVDDGWLEISGSIASATVDVNGTATALNYAGSSDAGSAVITNNGQLYFSNSSTAGSTDITNNWSMSFGSTASAGTANITNDNALNFFDSSTAGDAAITNNSVVNFNNGSTAADATITTTNGGTTSFINGGSGGDATFITQSGGTLSISGLSGAGTTAGSIEGAGSYVLGAKSLAVGSNDASTTVSGVISGVGGSLTKVGNGTLELSGANTYTGATTVNDGALLITGSIASATVDINAGGAMHYLNSSAGNATMTNNIGGDLFFHNGSSAGNATITNDDHIEFRGTSTASDATVTTTSGGDVIFIETASGGDARFITQSGGTFDISGLASAGTTAGSIEGAGNYVLGDNILEVGSNDASTEVSGVISGVGGSLTKVGTGTLELSGTNTYTGATDVDDGVLRVNGSLASSLTTINSGATLGGTGTLGDTTVSGGTLAPGNSIGTITVNGDLIFGASSTYDVEVSPISADRTDVTGFATLDGTVQATFSAGSYMDNSYTILSAAGGLGGSTFDTLSTINLPTGFEASLDYVGNDLLLTLEATFTPPAGGLNRNQQGVADAVTAYFNDGGTLPPAFVTLFALTGEELSTALSQLSGEATAAAQHSVTQNMNRFLGLMFAPRAGAPIDSSLTFGLASATPVVALPIAYGLGEKFGSFDSSSQQLWSVWASAFAGGSATEGDPATGSHDFSAHAYGFAMGLDYNLSPDTMVGLAFSSGYGSWALSGNLGGGRSRDYQLGLNGALRGKDMHAMGSLAYGFHQISTERYVTGGDQLTADFGAHSFTARIEGGKRYTTEIGGLTPYAAAQAQVFLTPAYREDDPGGSGFALTYGERQSTSARAELGSRFDHAVQLDEWKRLNLNARLAYAHEWMIGDPSLIASFQSLPGASFTVNSAAPPENLALLSLGAELFLNSHMSLSGRFDGELAGASTSFAGIGTVRLTW